MSQLEEKLARSLTAETTELIPYLSYLLQNLWDLGSSPADILHIVTQHVRLSEKTRVLDLACGKGAVSVHLASKAGCQVKGIDIMPDFIAFARQKADEQGVANACTFEVGDVNEAVKTEKNYDIVVFGAVGDVLGDPQETITKLKNTLRPEGYLVIDDAYGRQGIAVDYYSKAEWLQIFCRTGVRLIDEIAVEAEKLNDLNRAQQAQIMKRAQELKEKHPDKTHLFDGYIQSQQAECDLIEHDLSCVTLLLQLSV